MSMLNALGTLYTKQKNWSAALRHYQRAQQLATEQHDQVNGTINEINVADVYRLQGQYALAKAHG